MLSSETRTKHQQGRGLQQSVIESMLPFSPVSLPTKLASALKTKQMKFILEFKTFLECDWKSIETRKTLYVSCNQD